MLEADQTYIQVEVKLRDVEGGQKVLKHIRICIMQ